MRVRSHSGSLLLAIFLATWMSGCGGGGGGSSSPPPPAINVSVSPGTTSVFLGGTQTFNATVTNTAVTGVVWTVSGTGCSGMQCGTIDANGMYTAPAILPSSATVTIRATSLASASRFGTATVTLTSDVSVSAMPATANVELGASAQFAASVSGSGNPDRNVTWEVACGAPCGTVTSAGLYTAPAILPSPATVMVIARSVADASKTGSVAVTVTSNFTVTISGPAMVDTGATAQFNSTVTPVPGSNPSTSVNWTVNGILGGDATVGTITTAGFYTAPLLAPSPNMVTVTATSQADPAESGTSTVNLFSNIQIQVTPVTATRAPAHVQTLGIAVQNTSNPRVQWRVNGVAGGDATNGMICVSGFSPCQQISGFTSDPAVDYLAPSNVAGDKQVTVTATSEPDPAMSFTVVMTLIPTVRVSVLPANSTLSANGRQSLFATVLGTDDQRVTWTVNGIPNGDATVGMICTAGSDPCIAPSGPLADSVEYLAPAASPGPITITATSTEDPAQSGSGMVTISNGPFIQTLQPSSFFATDAGTLTLRVQGLNFIAGAATILFNGSARSTNCASATQCTAQLGVSDFNTAGDKAVQVENPGTPPVSSNQVVLRVLPPDTTEDVITLDSAAPEASGRDILVVEPFAENAGGVRPDIEAIGVFVMTNCSAYGISVAVTRPAAGEPDKAVQICINGEGLDLNTRISISGPEPNDIPLSNVQSFGLGLQFTLTLRSTAQPGPRTLFVETSSKEKAAATAAIEVK